MGEHRARSAPRGDLWVISAGDHYFSAQADQQRTVTTHRLGPYQSDVRRARLGGDGRNEARNFADIRFITMCTSVVQSADPPALVRGLSIAFIRRLLLDKANYVFVTVPKGPADLTAPIRRLQCRYLEEGDDRLQLIRLDTGSYASIRAAAAEIEKLRPGGVDYVINNHKAAA